MASVFQDYSAFVIAATIYGALAWFGTYHISRESKDEMALWLLGAYNDTWQKHYSAFFDAVFGPRHFTISCFAKSSTLSVVAALAIYGSFTKFGVETDGRFLEKLQLFDILVLAIVINIIPDYISLFETRFIIRLFQKYRSVPLQFFILVIDFIASGLIIYCFISGYRYINGLGTITLVEMLGFFSVYSVFFYTTFLTSIWAWLFVLSSVTLKATRAIKIERFLNVWGNAPAQISLLISIYVFGFLMLLAPVARSDDELRATAFDQWLCEVASSAACPHVLRLTRDQQQRLSIQVRLCNLGRGDECFEAAQSFGLSGDKLRSLELHNSGCEVEIAESCLSAAAIVESDQPESSLDSRSLASKSCALGNGEGCALYGQLTYNAAETDKDERRALAVLKKGCQLNSSSACAAQGWMIENGRGSDAKPRMARVLYRDACEAGNATGCYLLGRHLEFGRTGLPNPERAKVRYRQACNLDHELACEALSGWKLTAAGSASTPLKSPGELCSASDTSECIGHGKSLLATKPVFNPVLAARYFEVACTMKDAEGCMLLGRMRQLGDGIPMDRKGAVAAFKTGCELGDQMSCLEATIHSAPKGLLFITESAQKHFDFLVATCEEGTGTSCERLKRFEQNPLFRIEQHYDEESCKRRGFDSCQSLILEGGRSSIP